MNDTPSPSGKAINKLHPMLARLARAGPYYDPHRVAMCAAPLGSEAVEALLGDPDLVGCYIPDPEARGELVAAANWLAERYPSAPQLRELGLEYVVVKHYGNKCQVFFQQSDGRWQNISPDEFKKAHANKQVAVGHTKSGVPIVKKAADVWLTHPSTTYLERAEFLPGQAAPPDVLNLWIPPSIKPHPTEVMPEDDMVWWRQWRDYPEKILLHAPHFAGHMLDNMCGGDMDIFDYLVGWMTDAVHAMHRTSDVAVVLRGPQGSGKGFWAKHFMEFFAPHTLTLNNPRQLTGNFNSHLQAVCMVFADEAFFAGNTQQSASLKTLITDNEIFIEPKGVDGFMAPKRWRVIIASNNDHVIKADSDDRRFLVLDVDAGEHNNDKPYFAEIARAWKDRERDALFQWLTSPESIVWHDRTWPGLERPITRALTDQKMSSLSPENDFLLGILEEGAIPAPRPDNNSAPTATVLSNSSHPNVDGLLQAMRRSAPKLRDASNQRLAKSLKEWGCEAWKSHNERGWTFPPLADMRAAWDRRFGEQDWADDGSEWLVGPKEPEPSPF